MLILTTPEKAFYRNDEFVVIKGKRLRFEHSLKAIAEWEAIYERPFLKDPKAITPEEWLVYYKLMCIDRNLSEEDVTYDLVDALANYINRKGSATVIEETEVGQGGSFLTAEVIYAQMAMGGIPFECECWNVNRLLTLIRVISEMNSPKKPMSRNDTLSQNARLNAERKAQLKSKG